MKGKKLAEITYDYFHQKRRMIAPLMGFPGVELIQSNIKLAQQNSEIHFKAIKKLVNRFSPDIIFPLMDLSVEANSLGQYTIFPQTDTAVVPKPENGFCFDTLDQLKEINLSMDSRVNAYIETMKFMKVGLSESLIKGAYVTGPYTLTSLMLGANDAAIATLTRKSDLHRLCEFVTEKIQEYIRLLISAGAEIICYLEPSAVMLGPDQFEEFSSFYIRYLNESCRYSRVNTIYHTCGNTMHLIKKMTDSGVHGISLDSPEAGVDLSEAAGMISNDVIIMGNINPSDLMLRGTPDLIRENVTYLMKQMDFFPHFILSTGCDLPQETPEANIHAFMETGRNYRIK